MRQNFQKFESSNLDNHSIYHDNHDVTGQKAFRTNIAEFREKIEILEKLETGMTVMYITKNGEKCFGSLLKYKDQHNFTFLPINQKSLDEIENGIGLTGFDVRNAQGTLKKVILPDDQKNGWKLWAEGKYGQNSDSYTYLQNNLDYAFELNAGKKTRKLINIPSKLNIVVLDETNDQENQPNNNIVEMIKCRPKKLKNKELLKYNYFKGKEPLEKKLEIKNNINIDAESPFENNLLPEVDGFRILEDIYFYNENQNKIKKGKFICKSELTSFYMIDKCEGNNSVTKKSITRKRIVESIPCEFVSKNHLDLLKFVKHEQPVIIEQKIDTPLFHEKIDNIKVVVEEEKKDKFEDIFINIDFENNFSSSAEFGKVKNLIDDKEDAGLFFEQCHQLLSEFQNSAIFEFTINDEIRKLDEIRTDIDNLNFRLDAKKIQYLYNQILKLKWITKLNHELQQKFSDENMLGNISAEVQQKCAYLINQKIHGNHDAKIAIEYWTKNKNWLFNQVQIIKQNNLMNSNVEKKSIWQRGLSKVKSWFGR